jgi:hypothetical protein
MSTQTNPLEKVLEHLLKYKKTYLTLLLIIILLFPNLIRIANHNPTIIGPPSYYHLKLAEQTSLQNPYHLLLSLNFIQNTYLYQAIPLILALLSIILLIYILNQTKLNPKHQFLFLFFLIVSPAFIYTFTILNHHSFFLFLILLGITLLLQKNKLKYLAFPTLAIIPFFDLFSSLLTLLILEAYFYFQNHSQKKSWWSFQYLKKDNLAKTLFFLIIFLTILNIFLKKSFLLGPYTHHKILLNLFSDLGGLFGLSLFSLLLAIIGIFALWKKEKIFLAYIFIPLFILFFFHTPTLIYLNFFIAFFASAGFLHLYKREWNFSSALSSLL